MLRRILISAGIVWILFSLLFWVDLFSGKYGLRWRALPGYMAEYLVIPFVGATMIYVLASYLWYKFTLGKDEPEENAS